VELLTIETTFMTEVEHLGHMSLVDTEKTTIEGETMEVREDTTMNVDMTDHPLREIILKDSFLLLTFHHQPEIHLPQPDQVNERDPLVVIENTNHLLPKITIVVVEVGVTEVGIRIKIIATKIRITRIGKKETAVTNDVTMTANHHHPPAVTGVVVSTAVVRDLVGTRMMTIPNTD